MDCNTPGLPVHHQLPELDVHRVRGAIQPSHLLSPLSPPAFSLSQYEGLFHWVSSSHQVAKVLELRLQHQSFQWIFRIDFLEDWLVGSPCSPRDSQESSPLPQFRSINCFVLSLLYSPTVTYIPDYWKSHSFDWRDLCWQSCPCFLICCLGLPTLIFWPAFNMLSRSAHSNILSLLFNMLSRSAHSNILTWRIPWTV